MFGITLSCVISLTQNGRLFVAWLIMWFFQFRKVCLVKRNEREF